ncbi:Oligopeptidase A [Aphelenchoides besseyi]|nr:Oligopeptidase A [Aphelenchoides besseyi]KAI6208292.1 Oligopeptidase A [Aphelenchoides besseyi]
MRTLGYRCTNRPLKRLLSTASSSAHSNRNKPLLFVKQKPTSESQNRGIVFKIHNEPPHKITGYFVTFPSIPDKTIENNSHLANIAQNADWPALSTASPKEFYEDKNLPLDFDHVVAPLTTEAYDMEYAFNTLLLKMLTDWPECSRFAFDFDMHHVKMMCGCEKMEKLGNQAFQDALLKAEHMEEKEQVRGKIDRSCCISRKSKPLELADGTKRREVLLVRGHVLWVNIENNVIWTNSDHKFDIPTAKALNDAPPHVKQILSTTVRQTMWQSWISRAAFDHQHYNNSVNIEELRHNAEGLAKTLGYGSISEHRLANKMAGITVIVRKFLSALTRRMCPAFQERMESWQLYATAQEYITGGLEAFDMFYVCRREAEAHSNIRKPCSTLQPSVWLKICGKHLGRLYIDPFQRKNKKGHWNTFIGRPANQICGLDKLVYLIGDANEPTVAPNGQSDFSLLHYSPLKDMLFQVGRAVQLLCSRSLYRELTIPQAPSFSADGDGVDYFPTFVRFFMYNRVCWPR